MGAWDTGGAGGGALEYEVQAGNTCFKDCDSPQQGGLMQTPTLPLLPPPSVDRCSHLARTRGLHGRKNMLERPPEPRPEDCSPSPTRLLEVSLEASPRGSRVLEVSEGAPRLTGGEVASAIRRKLPG